MLAQTIDPEFLPVGVYALDAKADLGDRGGTGLMKSLELSRASSLLRRCIGTGAILHFLALTCARTSIYCTIPKCTVELYRSPVRGGKANDRAREEQYPIIAV